MPSSPIEISANAGASITNSLDGSSALSLSRKKTDCDEEDEMTELDETCGVIVANDADPATDPGKVTNCDDGNCEPVGSTEDNVNMKVGSTVETRSKLTPQKENVAEKITHAERHNERKNDGNEHPIPKNIFVHHNKGDSNTRSVSFSNSTKESNNTMLDKGAPLDQERGKTHTEQNEDQEKDGDQKENEGKTQDQPGDQPKRVLMAYKMNSTGQILTTDLSTSSTKLNLTDSHTSYRISLEKEITLLKLNLAEAQTTADTLQNSLTRTTIERNALSKSVSELTSKCETMSVRADESSQVIEHLQAKARESAIERDSLTHTAEKMSNERNQVFNKIKTLKNDNKFLKRELLHLEKSLEGKDMEIQGLRSENEWLKRQLRDATYYNNALDNEEDYDPRQESGLDSSENESGMVTEHGLQNIFSSGGTKGAVVGSISASARRKESLRKRRANETRRNSFQTPHSNIGNRRGRKLELQQHEHQISEGDNDTDHDSDMDENKEMDYQSYSSFQDNYSVLSVRLQQTSEDDNGNRTNNSSNNGKSITRGSRHGRSARHKKRRSKKTISNPLGWFGNLSSRKNFYTDDDDDDGANASKGKERHTNDNQSNNQNNSNNNNGNNNNKPTWFRGTTKPNNSSRSVMKNEGDMSSVSSNTERHDEPNDHDQQQKQVPVGPQSPPRWNWLNFGSKSNVTGGEVITVSDHPSQHDHHHQFDDDPYHDEDNVLDSQISKNWPRRRTVVLSDYSITAEDEVEDNTAGELTYSRNSTDSIHNQPMWLDGMSKMLVPKRLGSSSAVG